MPSKPRVIYWFRTDLRLHDSPALKAALDLQPEVFFPIWTWDPHYVYHARVGPNRWQFLTDCQRDLSQSLTKINKKQKLHVIREAPQTVFPKLFKLWKITHLVFEKDTDAYARDRDNQVIRLAKEAGVEVIVKNGRTLYDPDELVKANGNKPTMSMSQVQHASSKLGEPPKPIPAPKSVPDPGDVDLSSIDHEIPESTPDVNAVHRTSKDSSYSSIMGPNKDFAVPTLTELGIPKATTLHRGGETVALANLSTILSNKSYVASFSKPQTAPTDFQPQSTTLLSPYLHFGSLSVRRFYWSVVEIIETVRKAGNQQVSGIPTNLPGQLLFREMYFAAQAAVGHPYVGSNGNPICRFIPWQLSSKDLQAPSDSKDHKNSTSQMENELSYNVTSEVSQRELIRWTNGLTGFPFIDALMRQLRYEGWIHHLGRHAVACFLTRGGCYIHWERGAEVFEELLLDHEPACNAGNWMWLSCTAFFSQYYRCYSPVAFGRKWDPHGTFVRKYVPELSEFDDKYIYEPWKAPIADQKRWGCRVDGDGQMELDLERLYQQRDEKTGEEEPKASKKLHSYPKPMFDFNQRRDFCIGKLKQAYNIGLYGDDEKVLNGEWRLIFGVEDDKEQDQELNGHIKINNDSNPSRHKNKTSTANNSSSTNHTRTKRSQTTLDNHVDKAKKVKKQ